MAGTVKLTIDGRPVEVPGGTTILKAAESLGIRIPTLCYHPRLEAIGACRVCVVEVEGHPRPVASCQALAEDGMKVITDSPEILEARQDMMRLVLVDHPLDCPVCDMCGECELQDRTVEMRVQEPAFRATRPTPQWKITPLVEVVPSRCIMCGRCVAVCNELQGADTLTYTSKDGFKTAITVSRDGRSCENCGQCVDLCPVGTLVDATFRSNGRPWEHQRTATVCPYCGVGCTLDLNVLRDRIERVTRPESEGPGRRQLCVMGQFGVDFVHSPHRITEPLIRRGAELKPASWEEACELVAQRLERLRDDRGSDSIATLVGPRISNEAAFQFQAFTRQVLGSRNLVGPDDRAGDALREALGIGVSPSGMDAILEAEVILAFGPGIETDEPLAANWIVQAARRGARLLLAGPYHGKLGRLTRHRLVSAEGDEGLVARELLLELARREGGLDEDVWSGLSGGAELRAQLEREIKSPTPAGLDPEVLGEFAGYIAGRRLVCVLSEGEGSSSYQAVRELLNLLLATDNLTGPGRGLVLLGGAMNRRGVRDMGCSGTHLPGGAGIGDPAARRAFQLEGGRSLGDRPGLSREELATAVGRQEIRGLFLLGADPRELPGWHPAWLEKADLDLVVVQDSFLPEGIDQVDVVLPASRFAEQTGTTTSSSRRIQRAVRALPPAGASRSDLEILADLATRLGGPSLCAAPEEVLDTIQCSVASYAGITPAGARAGRIWPLGATPEEDGRITPAGGAEGHRLSRTARPAPVAAPDTEHPLLLQWLRRLDEAGPQSEHSTNLALLEPRPLLRLPLELAKQQGLTAGCRVEVASSEGRLELPVEIDPDVAPGFVMVESLSAAQRATLGISRFRPAVAVKVGRANGC